MFSKYHYLNTSIASSCQCYVAILWGNVVGFIAVQHFPHRFEKRFKKVSRLVVLPDYQGVGIGKILLDVIGDMYTQQGYRFTITTSHPALNRSLSKQPKWKLLRQGRVSRLSNTANSILRNTLSIDRLTCTWEIKS